MTLTVGSLFSGIGGLDLGLERAGMTCKWQVEIDPFCQKVLKKHWPDVPKYEDVRDVGAANLEPVDLICGGFPCQDVSLAGERKGLEGKRSTLWTEYARIIGELRPAWVLAENVPGLFSANGGQFFGTVQRDLAELGYDAEWDVLPAAAFGAPHRRNRVFIVAYPLREQAYIECCRPRELGRQPRQPMEAGAQTARQAQREAGNNNATRFREVYPYPNGEGLAIRERRIFGEQKNLSSLDRCDWWSAEPAVGRVAHGVPHRVDRLKSLGNAVVPQVAEWIGKRIVEASA
jgi:DNA (cytosine-5)-methyltransferase 1